MTRRTRWNPLLLGLAITGQMTLMALVAGCSRPYEIVLDGAKFASVDSSLDAPQGATLRQSFKLNWESAKLDLVWVIDNSGSMNEESAHVRSNLAAFVTAVQQRVDLKMAIISTSDTGHNGVQLPAGLPSDRFVQIDQKVASTNALAMLASASCAANLTVYSASMHKLKLCDQTFSNVDGPFRSPGSFELASLIEEARGKLHDFYRPEADRAVVIVTDDIPTGITDANLISVAFQTGSRPKVFAFRGFQARPGCAISKPGIPYEALAEATGGMTYDICDTNWNSHFEDLTRQATSLVSRHFSLDVEPSSVAEVSCDGQVLAPDRYSIEGQEVVLLSVPAGTQSCQIEYVKK